VLAVLGAGGGGRWEARRGARFRGKGFWSGAKQWALPERLLGWCRGEKRFKRMKGRVQGAGGGEKEGDRGFTITPRGEEEIH